MPNFPGYHPTPASQWVQLPEDKQELLRKVGGFPVNDIFMPLWQRPVTLKREIVLPYGTYGSGKTVDRIQEGIITCLTEPKYFKGYYGREIFELAKSELHSTFVRVIEEMGYAHLFEYSKKPNGSKVITCKQNGFIFKPFGCDDEESFKGWDDPTWILVDEINQISFKSFGMLQSRLRKKNAKKCLVGCFNNCDVMEDHWIQTDLRNPAVEMLDDDGNVIDRNIIEHLSFFTDNYFIDQEDYRNQLIAQAGSDPIRRDAILNAKWGAKTATNPFYKNFANHTHVRPVKYNRNLALHISFDENVNPYFPVGLFQCEGKNIYVIDEIAAENPNNTIKWVCNNILTKYGPGGLDHKAGVYVYGDATSVKDDVKQEKGKNMFTLIKEGLAYFKPKLRVPRANPNVTMRGNFINAIFGSSYEGLSIVVDPSCRHMIADLINIAEAPDGNGKDKTKTTVDGIRGVQKWGHFTDLLDYMICEAYCYFYNKFQRGGTGQGWVTKRRQPRHRI